MPCSPIRPLTQIGRYFCSQLQSSQGDIVSAQIAFNSFIVPRQTGSAPFIPGANGGRASATGAAAFDLQLDATTVYCPAYTGDWQRWDAVNYPPVVHTASNGS